MNDGLCGRRSDPWNRTGTHQDLAKLTIPRSYKSSLTCGPTSAESSDQTSIAPDEVHIGTHLGTPVLSPCYQEFIAAFQQPYAPLNRAIDEIRLVKVLPQRPGGQIRCRTATYAIGDAPKYLALSYRWGNADTECSVELNGSSAPVTKNLWRFLKHVQPDFKQDLLWIDALCINQSDEQERTHQVGMMAQIYNTASCVLVWLGPDYDGSESAMKSIDHGPDHWSTRSSNKLWRSSDGSAIRSLCDRAYWSRLWIVQELILAKDALILCGRQFISWKRFEVFLRTAAAHPPTSRTEHRSDYHLAMQSRATALIKDLRQAHRKRLLADQILAFGHLQCSDPRDKVYALLSISKQVIRDSITPDYAIGAFTLFNRVLEQDFLVRAPTNLDEVRERVDRLASALRISKAWILTLEPPDGSTEIDYASGLSDTSTMDVSLSWCLRYKHFSVVDLWLKGTDATIDTAFLQAAQSGESETCLFLLEERSANIDCVDREGRTALFHAVTCGHLEVVEVLRWRMAITFDLDFVISCAAHCPRAEILQHLLSLVDVPVGIESDWITSPRNISKRPWTSKARRSWAKEVRHAIMDSQIELVSILLRRPGRPTLHLSLAKVMQKTLQTGNDDALHAVLDAVDRVPDENLIQQCYAKAIEDLFAIRMFSPGQDPLLKVVKVADMADVLRYRRPLEGTSPSTVSDNNELQVVELFPMTSSYPAAESPDSEPAVQRAIPSIKPSKTHRIHHGVTTITRICYERFKRPSSKKGTKLKNLELIS